MLKVEEIKRFIDEDTTSEKKRAARVGQRYYEAEHDILQSRLFYYNADGILVEDKTRSNIKICHPFFTELVEQLPAYMLSSKDNPIRAKDNANGLQEHLDHYFDDEFWAEIYDLIIGTNAKGFEYIYAYKNADNRLAFQCADSMGVVEVRENDTDDGCKYVIYWYIDRIEKGKKEIKRIQVWSENDVTYYVQSGKTGKIEIDRTVEVNPRPHVVYKDPNTGKKMGYGLGFIPFWRMDNNRKQCSALRPIKALIDDYDMMMCGLSNNLADFDTPLHVVSGFQGDNLDELQQNLKTKKIVGVDAEGGVSVQTVDIPYQARQVKAAEDENNIYRFGMGFNSAQVGDGNITNVVIRSRYTLLDLKANKMEKRLRQLLKQILKVVLAEINKENEKDYQVSDTYFEFTRDIMTNATENIQNELVQAQTEMAKVTTILNVAANIGSEETLKAICEAMDLDYEEVKAKAPAENNPEEDLFDARDALEGVMTDEQKAAASAAAIS